MTIRMKEVQKAEIIRLAEAGISYARIGALFGFSRQRVHYVARRAGVSRNPGRARHDWATWRVAKAETRLVSAVAYELPKDPATLAAMDRLASRIHAIVAEAQS